MLTVICFTSITRALGRGATTRELPGEHQGSGIGREGDCRRSDVHLDRYNAGLDGRILQAVTEFARQIRGELPEKFLISFALHNNRDLPAGRKT